MPKITGPIFNETHFNSLLEQTFLNLDLDDPKNEAIIDAVSNTILLNSDGAIHSTQTSNLKQLLRKINLNVLVIFSIVAMVTTIGVFSFYIISNPSSNGVPAPVNYKLMPKVGNNLQPYILIKDTLPLAETKSTINKKESDLLISKDCTKVDKVEKIDIPDYTGPIVLHTLLVETPDTDSTYVFPKLTEKEIKDNYKQRKKMLEQLLKLNKSRYAQIPKGQVNYKAEAKNVGEFYMQNYEITNLEYRTFLLDLLIQNKKEVFLKSKPKQFLWVNSNGSHLFDTFKEEYFFNKKFYDHPVVNISVQGAQLYCEWLTALARSNSDTKDKNMQNLTVRLPKESEWTYAAMGGFNNAVYPWGFDSIQNSKNCFLANFCIQKSKEKFNQPIVYNHPINWNSYTSAGLALNTDTVATVRVASYSPNRYGLYCMSGNVSEIVIADQTNSANAVGGNWGSDFEHLRINSDDEFEGKVKASPFIGFRPVIFFEAPKDNK